MKGGIGICPPEVDGCVVTENMPMFEIVDINPEYLLNFIKSPTFKQEVNKLVPIGTAQKALHENKLLEIEIPYPSEKDQEKVVKKIQSMENEINGLEQNVSYDENLLSKLKQAILSEAVQGKLVEQNSLDESAVELLKKIKGEKEKLIKEGKIKKGKELPEIEDDEIPYELPRGWVWVRLGDVCEKLGSGSTPRGGKSVYKNEGIKFIRSQNVYNYGLNFKNIVHIEKEVHSKMFGTKVFPNDLLLNITGGSIGRCALIPNIFDEANVSQHVTIIRTKKELISKFAHILILSPYFQNKIMIVQTGANREGLAKKNMQLMLFPLPPLAEQKRIVEKIDSLMGVCDELKLRIGENKENSERLMGAVLGEVFGK